MKTLYIMCGLAFSGKSTLASKIAEKTGSELVGFDKLWVEMEKKHPLPEGGKGWRKVRSAGKNKVFKLLQKGQSVVYDDNNPKLEHRQEFRDLAEKLGVRSFVVYLDTPIDVIRGREDRNRTTLARHEVKPENFKTVQEHLEPPTEEENILVFKPGMDIDAWVDKIPN